MGYSITGSSPQAGSAEPHTGGSPWMGPLNQPSCIQHAAEEPGSAISARHDRDGFTIQAEIYRKVRQQGDTISVGSAALRFGRQNEVALRLAQLSHPIQRGGHCNAELLSLKLGQGALNPDGSVGHNTSALVTGLGVECGLAFDSGHSITGGLSLSWGTAVSIGSRDVDRDGRPEVCARVSAGPVTIGGCVELPVKPVSR